MLIQLWKRLLRVLYFPEETFVYIDIGVRFAFAVYYLPIMAIVLALSHSCLESLIYTLVVPVARGLQRYVAAEEKAVLFDSPLLSGLIPAPLVPFLRDRDLSPLLRVALESVVVVGTLLPYIALGLTIAMVGHKLMSTLAEAMVDASSRMQGGKDYPLVAARLRFVFNNPRRHFNFSIVCGVVYGTFFLLATTNWLIAWISRPPTVLAAAWVIIAFCIVYAYTTIALYKPKDMPVWETVASRERRRQAGRASLRDQERSLRSVDRWLVSFDPEFVRFVTGTWWRRSIHRIRHLAIEILCVFSAYWALFGGGLITSVAYTVEVMIYLNIPHILGFVSLAISVAIVRRLHSLLWIIRHRHRLPGVLAAIGPMLVPLVLSLAGLYDRPACVLLLSFAIGHLLSRAIELARAFDVHPSGGGIVWEELRREAPPPDGSSNNLASLAGLDDAGPPTGDFPEPEDIFGESLTSTKVLQRLRGKTVRVPLPESYAITAEDAFERGKDDVGVVGLDIVMDVQKMQLFRRHQQGPSEMRRTVVPPPPSARRSFVWYAMPRLLLLHGSDGFSGRRFSNVRRMQKGFVGGLLIALLVLVIGMVVQAAIPALQAPDVRWAVDDHLRFAKVDHFIVRLSALGRGNAPTAEPLALEADAIQQDAALRDMGLWVPEQRRVGGDADEDDRYPGMCRATFANDISLFELGWLSLLAYLPTDAAKVRLLEFLNSNMHTDWRLATRLSSAGEFVAPFSPGVSAEAVDGHDTSAGDWSGFSEFYEAGRDVYVTAVRGTDFMSVLDILQNVNLFFETGLYQVLSSVVPGSGVLPTNLVSDFIRIVSITDVVSRWGPLSGRDGAATATDTDGGELRRVMSDREYYVRIMKYVEGRLAAVAANTSSPTPRSAPFSGDDGGAVAMRAARRKVLVTGHSLGGGISHIIGARLGLRSIGFNSPGIVLPHRKFGIASTEDIHRHTFTVAPTNDIVPYVGWQGGELHHIECQARTRELCHAVEFVIATMWHACPSIRRRFPDIKNVY